MKTSSKREGIEHHMAGTRDVGRREHKDIVDAEFFKKGHETA